VALPGSLRELTVNAPWQGCAAQLAPLQGLTSLAFEKSILSGYSEQELGAATAAVQGLTQLRRLKLWPTPLPAQPSMPPQMAEQFKQALPWCTLDYAPPL
jgi:hypothetical protein